MTQISCIIPTYNCAAYLGHAIESALNQTHPIDQLIVVDDGSVDHTPEIIARYADRLMYVRKEHSGVAKTVNRGLLEATGSFITFLDSDDLWHKDKTLKQFDVMNTHPEIDMVFCLAHEFVSPEIISEKQSSLIAREAPMKSINKSGGMLRKSLIDAVGVFSAEDDMGDFIEWYTRAQHSGARQIIIDEVLTYRRIHFTNFTRTGRMDLKNYAQILKRKLDMQRQHNPHSS